MINNDLNKDNMPFRIHQIAGYISTVYLLEYPEGLLLLDCGSASDVPKVKETCERIGRSPGDIKLAVATHAHPDHMGGAGRLRQQYSLPIAAHPDIDGWYKGVGGFIQHKIDCFFADWVAFKSGYHLKPVGYKRSIKPDYYLMEQPLPIFPDWQVMYNPGHTLHDIALYHADSGVLYWADSICQANGKLHLPVPVLYPDLMRQSLQRMVALAPRQLLLAHGGVFLVNDQELLGQQVNAVLNQEVNPHIDRLHSLFLFSKAARQGLQTYAGRHGNNPNI